MPEIRVLGCSVDFVTQWNNSGQSRLSWKNTLTRRSRMHMLQARPECRSQRSGVTAGRDCRPSIRTFGTLNAPLPVKPYPLSPLLRLMSHSFMRRRRTEKETSLSTAYWEFKRKRCWRLIAPSLRLRKLSTIFLPIQTLAFYRSGLLPR